MLGPYTVFLDDEQSPRIETGVDATTGNSGSPIIDMDTCKAIAIVDVAGICNYANGPAVTDPGLLAAIANPKGVCVPDCNGNDKPDADDIAMGTSEDCGTNGNGIPDECEPDCNGNDKADTCEIAMGSATDCLGDGIPDECEDCNSNGIPDGEECFPHDYDRDGDGDLRDFAYFQICFNTNGVGVSFHCACAFDLDSNGFVDLDDYASLEEVLSTNGPVMPCWYEGYLAQYAPGGGYMMGMGGAGAMWSGGEGLDDSWTLEESSLSIEVWPVHGTQAVTQLAPDTTYELHYTAGYSRVNFHLLTAITTSPAQGFAAGTAPRRGAWSDTGNFEFQAWTGGDDWIEDPDAPAGNYRFQTIYDDFWPETEQWAGATGHVCNFTTGSAGVLYLGCYMAWIDPEDFHAVGMYTQTRYLVAGE